MEAAQQRADCRQWQRCGHSTVLLLFVMDTIRAEEALAACMWLWEGREGGWLRGADLVVTGK